MIITLKTYSSGIKIVKISKYSSKYLLALSLSKTLLNSSWILSMAIFLSKALFSNKAFFVSLSIVNPSLEANLIALKILKASSLNLKLGSPIALICFFFKSSKPPTKSIYSLLKHKALIVKSLLLRSSTNFLENSIFSGLL